MSRVPLLLVAAALVACGGSKPPDLPELGSKDASIVRAKSGKEAAEYYDQAAPILAKAAPALGGRSISEVLDASGPRRDEQLEAWLKIADSGIVYVGLASKEKGPLWGDPLKYEAKTVAANVAKIRDGADALCARAEVLLGRKKYTDAAADIGAAVRVATHLRQQANVSYSDGLARIARLVGRVLPRLDRSEVDLLAARVKNAREGLPSYKMVIHLDNARGQSRREYLFTEGAVPTPVLDGAYAMARHRYVALLKVLKSRDKAKILAHREETAGWGGSKLSREELADDTEQERNIRHVAGRVMASPDGLAQMIKTHDAWVGLIDLCCVIWRFRLASDTMPGTRTVLGRAEGRDPDPYGSEPLKIALRDGVVTVSSVGPDCQRGTEDDLRITLAKR